MGEYSVLVTCLAVAVVAVIYFSADRIVNRRK